jgi:hypothetical protein
MRKEVIVASMLLFCPLVIADRSQAQDISTTGILKNSEFFKNWAFSEIRELDGKISGCWTGTSPVSGKRPLEVADFSIIAIKNGSEIIEKVGVIEVFSPLAETDDWNFPSTFLFVGDSGTQGENVALLKAVEKTGASKVRLESQLSERVLSGLAKEQYAAVKSLERPVLVYSLSGSSRAIARWRECRSEL